MSGNKSNVSLMEAYSKYYSNVKKLENYTDKLLSVKNQLVGKVSGDELNQLVLMSLSAAANLISFAESFISANEVDSAVVNDNCKKVLKASGKLKLKLSTAALAGAESSEEIYIDPYESEYMTEGLCIKENLMEDNDPLPEDLDDDPDAVFTLDPSGLPVKFNNNPIELDPFAVKLFRNNSEFIEPPEEFTPEVNAEVDSEVVDQVIDVVADTPEDESDVEKEKPEIPVADVELPSDDFDVFANESKSRVIPKTSAENVLPPKFEIQRTNANIAEDPANNLKMLSFLTQDW